MKLIIAVVQDQDVHELTEEVTRNGFRLTKLASTGGFLRKGNTTLLIGVNEEKLNDALQIIKSVCKIRDMVTSLTTIGLLDDMESTYPYEIKVGGATIFVLNIEKFERT